MSLSPIKTKVFTATGQSAVLDAPFGSLVTTQLHVAKASSTVSASGRLQGSMFNDAASAWVDLATLTVSGASNEGADQATFEASYPYFRFVLDSLTAGSVVRMSMNKQ